LFCLIRHPLIIAPFAAQRQALLTERLRSKSGRPRCKAAGKTCEFAVYPDAPHGFNADYRPSYRVDAAKDG
jgi:dienelactone hydrolase